jgi:gamma-D-glutamyl-L-lysine dipeptidyl-peptidase
MENRKKSTAVSVQGYIPVRKEPGERSEMVTQVLFGEYVDVLEGRENWLYIRTLTDHYEGWLDKKCAQFTDEVAECSNIVVRNGLRIRNITSGSPVILPTGSSLPETENGKFSLAGDTFQSDEAGGTCKPGEMAVSEIYNDLISIPYLWGGRCGFGFDCSGLTQFLCRVMGKKVPRDASEQSAAGTTLSFINEAETGDLAFFDNQEGVIHHVGMFVDKNRIIHASGTVRIDRIDQQGIYNEQLGRYTYQLRVIKRIT